MTQLRDAQVGDTVVVVDRTRGTTHERASITKVGRKYLTVRDLDFERDTGRYRNKQWTHHYRCYTVDEWTEAQERNALQKKLRALAERGVDRLPIGALRHLETLLDAALALTAEEQGR